nr:ribonuclease H-like domain-containing protein [Tanacetum cinerariifolium]
ALWEVILNGDSPIPTRVINDVVQPVAPTTADQRLARKNELKARETLLMALPDKHQLKLNIHKDAKSLMEAIEKRFGWNKATKKVQKTFLKQCLPTEWRTHTFIWRNKTDLEDQSLDDLFNSLKIYKAEVKVSAVTSVSAPSTKVHVSALPNEMDRKWQMAMLTMRARRFLQRTKRNLGANETTSIGFDMSKVEYYNCHRRWHFARECMSPKDTRNKETQRRNVPADEEPTNYALMTFTSSSSSSSSSSDNEVAPCSKACLESVKARIVVYQQNENVFKEDTKLLKLDVMLRDNTLVDLRKKFKKAEQERDELKLKLENFQTSSKNLSQLQASQITDKTGLDYDNQVFKRTMFDSNELISSESDVSMPASSVYDSPTKPNKDLSHSNRPFSPIIEDWVSDSEDEYEELKFNLFSVSQMCDKKNSVLFIDTECIILSSDFKLPDDNHVLLRVLRENNITPSIGFMRPFGCPVTILNTLDPLDKFDRKTDEGFLVGYSVSSKAFRVFNSRTGIVQETLHIIFFENQPNVSGSGPTWLFDIDTLTQSMNYQPVVAGNQPTSSACVQEHFDVDKAGEGNVQQYVLFPLWSSGSKDPQNTDANATFEVKEPESKVHVSPSSSAKTKKHEDKTEREAKGKSHVKLSTGVRNLCDDFEEFFDNSINRVNAASTSVTTVGQNSTNSTSTFSAAGPSNTAVSPTLGKSSYVNPSQYPDDPDMPALEDITYLDDEEDVGAEADFSNLETNITIIPIPTTRVHKDYPVTQIIGDLSSAPQTRSMTRMVKEQGGLTQINNDDFHICMFACFLSQEEPKR